MKHSSFISSLLSILLPMLITIFFFAVAGLVAALLVFYAKLKILGVISGKSFVLRDFLVDLLSGPRSRGAKFYSKQTLMSDPEQELFRRLVKALPDHFVFAQVAFSQFLFTDGGDRKEKFGTMATMKQKVADFVICTHRFNMVAVIELDDASHDAAKDARRDEVLREAGLKPVRWHVSKMPDAAKIRWDVLGTKGEAEGEGISRWAPRPS